MKVAVCLYCNDNPQVVNEWIQHYRRLGFDHFYIYDHRSPVSLSQLQSTDVTVIDWHQQNFVCIPTHPFDDCVEKFGHDIDWLGQFDVDEFLVLIKHNNIKELLGELDDKNVGSIGFYWRIFGSNGHQTKQADVTLNYTKRVPDNYSQNQHIKSLSKISAKPIYFPPELSMYYSHCPSKFANDNYKIKTTNGKIYTPDEIKNHKHQTSYLIAYINHYMTKSKEDWSFRIQRGSGTPNFDQLRQWNFFKEINSVATITDRNILFKHYPEKL